MNLRNKKTLAAKVFGVGKGRIFFVPERRDIIKEAMTRQDLKSLVNDGGIIIKEKSGRKKKVKRKNPRKTGKIKLKRNLRKRRYLTLTRKLRAYIKELKKRGLIEKQKVQEIRKKIRNKDFKSLAHLKTYLGERQK